MTIDRPDQERNRRLYSEFVGWLLYGGRRPGMLGPVLSFLGSIGGSGLRADLRRSEAGWELSADGTEPERLGTADVLRLVGSGQYHPRDAIVAPDLAGLLYMEAVHQAEVAATKVHRADAEVERMLSGPPEHWFEPWALAATELDRALRAGTASIVLSIAADEAQLNAWAKRSGGWQDDEDWKNVVDKCKVLADRARAPVSSGSGPYQHLQTAVDRRNTLVHSSPQPQRVPVTGAGQAQAGRWIVLEARGSCLAVRRSLIDLAHRLGVGRPGYLVHCPPGEANDDEAWATATLMAGVRPDPNFPKVGSADGGTTA